MLWKKEKVRQCEGVQDSWRGGGFSENEASDKDLKEAQISVGGHSRQRDDP